jgi:hypothetical protein
MLAAIVAVVGGCGGGGGGGGDSNAYPPQDPVGGGNNINGAWVFSGVLLDTKNGLLNLPAGQRLTVTLNADASIVLSGPGVEYNAAYPQGYISINGGARDYIVRGLPLVSHMPVPGSDMSIYEYEDAHGTVAAFIVGTYNGVTELIFEAPLDLDKRDYGYKVVYTR